jgi:hypothetical protein
MTNANERANARALPETTNRRAVLGAVLAAGAAVALPALAGPAAATDPIFALIRRHQLAWARFSATCTLTDEVRAEREGREVTAADHLAYDTANDHEKGVMDELMDTPPATISGAVAILRYLIEINDGGSGTPVHPYLPTLLRSPSPSAAVDLVFRL